MSDINGLHEWLTSTDSVVSDCERLDVAIKQEKQRIQEALQQLEQQSAEFRIALDSITEEIHSLVAEMNEEDADSDTIRALQSQVSVLQSQRSKLMGMIKQLEQRQWQERENQKRVEQNTEKLRGYCHKAIASFDQKITDCQQVIARLQSAGRTAGSIAAMRFGGSAQQLGRSTDGRVQQYQTAIQRCVSQRWRMEQILNGLDDGDERVLERTR